MNKKLIYIICFVCILIICFCIYKNNTGLFYLDNEYYNNGEFIEVKNLDGLEKKSYLLFVASNYCSFEVPCEDIFKEGISRLNIDMVKINYDYFINTKYYKSDFFAPSVFIIRNGSVVDYLDAESNEDLSKYQDVDEFISWLEEYIYLEK